MENEFFGNPKFKIGDYVISIFPIESRLYTDGYITAIQEVEDYQYNEVMDEFDPCEIEGYHFVYTLDNGRHISEEIIKID